MRIEIMLGMNPKISQSTMDAFDAEINRRVSALCTLHFALMQMCK